jgi:DNA polymerase-4
MASEIKKPLGITELWVRDIGKKLWPLKVGKMYGIGQQTERRLNEIGIMTIGDLAHCSEKVLRSEFGKYGEEMKRLANGIDPSPVVPGDSTDIKSISRSITLSKDTSDIEHAMSVILSLAEEVGEEARRKNFKGERYQ